MGSEIRFVFDANIFLSNAIPSDKFHDHALKLFRRIQELEETGRIVRMVVPANLYIEVNNVLRKRARQGLVKLETKTPERLGTISIYPIDSQFNDFLISHDLYAKFASLGSQDIIYAAIAWWERIPLVTMDAGFNKIQTEIELINPAQSGLVWLG